MMPSLPFNAILHSVISKNCTTRSIISANRNSVGFEEDLRYDSELVLTAIIKYQSTIKSSISSISFGFTCYLNLETDHPSLSDFDLSSSLTVSYFLSFLLC